VIVSRASGSGPVLAPLEPLREQDSRPWLYSRGHYTAPFLHRAGRMDKAAESPKRDLRR